MYLDSFSSQFTRDLPLLVDNEDVSERQLRRLGVSFSNIPPERGRPSKISGNGRA